MCSFLCLLIYCSHINLEQSRTAGVHENTDRYTRVQYTHLIEALLWSCIAPLLAQFTCALIVET